ncbi:MAG: 23S rRNA (pseudouridine(1915)-N(3))-methyltransferase RlmH [Candidatus Omnitrophica bacterium]|nr:23S rRNA (pseudouridine(1915)-N(3))-methyltransferase RlmH [Candidatus Omnitrophota bacterium]
MKIIFHLQWMKPGTSASRGFKSAHMYALMDDYVKRLAHFGGAEIRGQYSTKEKGGLLWVCDFHKPSRELSSEDLAGQIEKLQDSGQRELHILIGESDGFKPGEIQALKPAFRWSFGPLTLPHELAAVVASEQIYRAFTMMKGLPYHTGH